MRNVTVYPGSANGIVAAPSSIEEALPAIILAAITKTGVKGVGISPDTISMFNGLFALGAKFRQEGDVVTFYTSPQKCDAVLDCTHKVMALLLPFCAVLGGNYKFLGEFDNSVIRGLDDPGIEWSVNEQGVSIAGSIKRRKIVLGDEAFACGFLLTLALNSDVEIWCDGCKNTLELTRGIMRDFGLGVEKREGYRISKKRGADTSYVYSVGGDYGKAAYLLLAGFLSGEVGVTGLLANSKQPKSRVIEELGGMKLRLQEMNGAVFAKKSRMGDETVDLNSAAEPLVVLVLACFCNGKCVIKNAGQLCTAEKEEFEIAAKALQSIGADIIRIGVDYFITGTKKLFGGNVDAHNSKNIAIALAVAGLCSEIGVTLSNAPDINELAALGVSLQ